MKSTIFLSYSLWILIFASCSTPQTQTSNEPIPAEANHSDKIEAIKLAETSQSWNGDSLPPYLEGTPKVTILKVKIPPKMELKLHKHNENGLPKFISFDNDLGLDEKGEVAPDGYAAVKWLVYESGLDLRKLTFKVHSANPVAAEQIRGLLNNYIQHLNEGEG